NRLLPQHGRQQRLVRHLSSPDGQLKAILRGCHVLRIDRDLRIEQQPGQRQGGGNVCLQQSQGGGTLRRGGGRSRRGGNAEQLAPCLLCGGQTSSASRRVGQLRLDRNERPSARIVRIIEWEVRLHSIQVLQRTKGLRISCGEARLSQVPSPVSA